MESPFSWDEITHTIDDVLDWHYEWEEDTELKAEELAQRLSEDYDVSPTMSLPVILQGLKDAMAAHEQMVCGWSTPMRIRQMLIREELLPPL